MDLNAVIERMMRLGPAEAMREDERAAGFEPVTPGSVPWLSADDWPDDIVVSIKGRDVRVVAIKAKEPGKGAFTRLIARITCAGLTPHVVEPLFDMPAILERWGWTHTVMGAGMDRQEIWTPRANITGRQFSNKPDVDSK